MYILCLWIFDSVCTIVYVMGSCTCTVHACTMYMYIVGREGPVPVPGEGSIPGLILVPGEGGIRGPILVLGEGDIQGLVLIPGDIPGLIPVLDPGTCIYSTYMYAILKYSM